MYKCEYCGRFFKEKKEACPGCGNIKLKYIRNEGTMRIETPPKGGYTLDLKNINVEKKYGMVGWIIELIVVICFMLFAITFVSVFFRNTIVTVIAAILCLIEVIVGIINLRKKINDGTRYNKTKLDRLKNYGVLIKNLNYKVKEKKLQNGQKYQYIQVLYEKENGKTLSLISEPKYNGKLSRDDGTVDLLIDPDDETNYFIDVDIY